MATRDPGASAQVKTILYIDDNDANILLMQRIFERRPTCRLITAGTIRGGLDAIRRQAPDFVLLDLGLPDGSGEQGFQTIRKEVATPIVLVTGETDSAMIERLTNAGAAGYITKPLDVNHLLAVVDELLLGAD